MRITTPLLLSLALLSSASAVNARQLSPSEALQRAMTVNSSRASGDDYTLSYTATAPSTSTPGVYVFTRPGGGFVMVSADDNAEALLGYSDSSEFSADAMSPDMRSWLESYASQVEWASTHPALSTASRASSSRPSREAIAPLLTTTWNQNVPYNNLCPTVTDAAASNGKAPTGCVATSTSQVMKYHNYPAKGAGKGTYTIDNTSTSETVDLSAMTFDWANMLNNYTAGSYNDTQATAVATLMKAAGAAVGMSYGKSESSASSFNQWLAIINNFSYSKSVLFSQRSWYGLYDWEDLIYNTLKNDGPAILGGQSGTGGHSFVCDGYQSDGYFHINWGWGGMSDGYFLLTALDPESQGTGGSEGGYNFNQDVITGIRRPATGDNYVYQMFAEDITPSAGPSARTVSMEYVSYNYSATNLSNVFYGIEVGGKFYFSNLKSNSLEPLHGAGPTFTVSLSDLPAGSYKAHPAFKCDEVSDGMIMKTDVTTEPYFTVNIASDGTVTIGEPQQNISFGEIDYETPVISGQSFSFSVPVTNSGDLEYSGAVTAIIIPQDSEGAMQLSQYALDVMPGESVTAQFSGTVSSQISAGTYTLYFANVNDQGEVSLLSDPYTLTVETGSSPVIGVSSVNIENSTAVNPDAITVTLSVNNTGGTFVGKFEIAIFAAGQNTTSNVHSTDIITIPANTTGQLVTVKFSFSDAVPGDTYRTVPYIAGNNQQLANGTPFTIAKSSSTIIDQVEADGEVISAIYTVSGQRVSATDTSDLAPGLYIIVTPAGSHKVVVD